MQQVKLFMGLEGDTTSLSNEINSWIKENNINVVQITGNIAPQSQTQTAGLPGSGSIDGRTPSDILIIVVYTTG